jgi:hypothetical protein
MSFVGIACMNGGHLAPRNVEMMIVEEKILVCALSVMLRSRK